MISCGIDWCCFYSHKTEILWNVRTGEPVSYPKSPESLLKILRLSSFFTEELFKLKCLPSILLHVTFFINPSLDLYIHPFLILVCCFLLMVVADWRENRLLK